MIPDPDDLRRREAGQGGVARKLAKALCAADGPGDPAAFVPSPLVAPEDGRPKDLVLLVEQHEPVHLASEPHAPDIGRLHTPALARPPYGVDGGGPPVRRVLFRPVRVRGVQGIGLSRGRNDGPVLVHNDDLGA